MTRPEWINEATRRARIGQSSRYIAYAMGVSHDGARHCVRPLTIRGRLYARHTLAGGGK